jgi:tripartite-type tricarboxylate transporter receptor subunit TctC
MLKTILALSLLAASAASAQSPIRIVVPFPPGGGADSLSRLMAPKLGELRKTQVIVENKPGATGHIGADAVAQAPADGNTLLMASTGAITEKNIAQFAPVSLVSASPYVVTASIKSGFNTLPDLLKQAKASPGKVTFGSSGTGAASHLSGELFKSMAKIDMLHVPYKGVGQAVTDLLAGQVDLLFAPAQAVIQHVRGGKLKALATTGAKRTETLPEVPTVSEAGVPGYESVGWFGLLVRAETPKALVDGLSADANRVLADAEIKKRMAALGADPAGNKPEEFARFIHNDQAKWSKVMRDAGIKPE